MKTKTYSCFRVETFVSNLKPAHLCRLAKNRKISLQGIYKINKYDLLHLSTVSKT